MKKGKKKEKGQRGKGLKEQEPGTESIGCSDLSIHAFQVSPDFILFFSSPPLVSKREQIVTDDGGAM